MHVFPLRVYKQNSTHAAWIGDFKTKFRQFPATFACVLLEAPLYRSISALQSVCLSLSESVVVWVFAVNVWMNGLSSPCTHSERWKQKHRDKNHGFTSIKEILVSPKKAEVCFIFRLNTLNIILR